ncbi:Cell number regulator 1 [Escovopsis weberi]|uniref:Cell number regulator 1 n=1 Tax=Escovopsis weberi TaxID=150374 RepID=A0A0M9VW65_ESCWE|nr:Cell number regulator 1 [Escovopsis weberi]
MSHPGNDPAIAPASLIEYPPAAAASAAATASQPQNEPKAAGALDDDDLNHWKKEIDSFLADPGEALSSRSADGARPWATSLFGCLCPADLCLLSFCCPCVVFGKTHHRVNKRSDMRGYEPVNVSCLLFFGTGLFGFQWIFEALQRAELEKEAEHREKTLVGPGQSQQQYARNEEMVYPEVV